MPKPLQPKLVAVSSELPDPPYSCVTRSGSLAFDVDVNRMVQSDTWAITTPAIRPYCLMTWVLSWVQNPCGTWVNNEEVIAARLGVELKWFAVHRTEIMRGWALHSDGRLYHPVITDRVLAMLKTRERWSQRTYNARKQAVTDNVTRDTLCVPAVSPLSCSVASTVASTVTEEHSRTTSTPKREARPESPEAVAEYAASIGFALDGNAFFDHYQSKGWLIGKASMKDWKAAVRTWKRTQHSTQARGPNATANGASTADRRTAYTNELARRAGLHDEA